MAVVSAIARANIKTDASQIVDALIANELVFAVVGPIGSGDTVIADTLITLLEKRGFEAHKLKASSEIEKWAREANFLIPEGPAHERVSKLQDAGDEIRKPDSAALATRLISAIREKRAALTGQGGIIEGGGPVVPDGKPRAYIVDSLKHPAEAALFRKVYQTAFCLIGVGCEEEERIKRLRSKFPEAGSAMISALIKRDQKDTESYGQRVADTFHLSDFFLDNSPSRTIQNPGGQIVPNPSWDISEKLGRLIDILTTPHVVRPLPNETGMFYAFGAKMRSACLSRQVGAALLDNKGNVLATGTNEVPRAGGGVYGNDFDQVSDDRGPNDFRCAYSSQVCSNTETQNQIIDLIIDEVDELKAIGDRASLVRRLKETPIGQLIEFSKAVHAEMDALLSASRQGVSTVGTRMFVTTYPCHNCARHIVAAGVDEVQFIEPYLKSRAVKLHPESITDNSKSWVPPSLQKKKQEMRNAGVIQATKESDIDHPKVLFRPFSGVAPRLYQRAFLKDRELKNRDTGRLEYGKPEAAIRSEPLRASYAEVEAKLSQAKRT